MCRSIRCCNRSLLGLWGYCEGFVQLLTAPCKSMRGLQTFLLCLHLFALQTTRVGGSEE